MENWHNSEEKRNTGITWYPPPIICGRKVTREERKSFREEKRRGKKSSTVVLTYEFDEAGGVVQGGGVGVDERHLALPRAHVRQQGPGYEKGVLHHPQTPPRRPRGVRVRRLRLKTPRHAITPTAQLNWGLEVTCYKVSTCTTLTCVFRKKFHLLFKKQFQCGFHHISHLFNLFTEKNYYVRKKQIVNCMMIYLTWKGTAYFSLLVCFTEIFVCLRLRQVKKEDGKEEFATKNIFLLKKKTKLTSRDFSLMSHVCITLNSSKSIGSFYIFWSYNLFLW